MRVVLDTNVLISGLVYGGKPDVILRLAFRRRFTLILSNDILSELEGVLLDKFRWSPEKIASALGDLRKSAEVVAPNFNVTDCADPDDNRILEAALEGAARAIISGDKHLLRMQQFRGVEIMTVSEFLLRFALELLGGSDA
jgi:putative PIN family toxin of toxin-antitoxin system